MSRTHMYEFMSEDYQNGWNDGYEAHRKNQQYPSERVRIEAFGAIRRAARIARDVEESPLSWMDDPPNESYAMGRGIRIAIRAAIGSDKT